MARTKLSIQLPEVTNTAPTAVKAITTKNLDATNGMELENSAECMRNTLQLHINAGAAGTITFKAGGHYPNSMRGDRTDTLASGINVVLIQDPSQFTTKDGSICFDLSTGLTGTIYASAKPTGLGQ